MAHRTALPASVTGRGAPAGSAALGGLAHRTLMLSCAKLCGMNMATSTSTATAPFSLNRASVSASPAARQTPRLLLVDNCRTNRMLVTAVLTRWGIVPTIACNGAQAVVIAQRQDFDLVLMDMLMPVMDGVVATAKIRQAEREKSQRVPVPIVAYTSLDIGANPEWMARVGFTALLAKPCNASTLQSCLARWCPDKCLIN